MQVSSFKTAQEMSDYQHDREVEVALRAQAMNGEELSQWLEENWSRLQNEANVLYANMPDQPATARCFETMAEKNEYQREREIEFALEFQSRCL